MFQQCEHILPDASQCTRVLNTRLSKLQRKGLQMRPCTDGKLRCHGGGKRGCFLAWQGAKRLAAEARLAQRREKGQQLARGRAAAQQPAAAVAAVAAVAPPQLSPMASPVTSPPSEMGRVAKRQRRESKPVTRFEAGPTDRKDSVGLGRHTYRRIGRGVEEKDAICTRKEAQAACAARPARGRKKRKVQLGGGEMALAKRKRAVVEQQEGMVDSARYRMLMHWGTGVSRNASATMLRSLHQAPRSEKLLKEREEPAAKRHALPKLGAETERLMTLKLTLESALDRQVLADPQCTLGVKMGATVRGRALIPEYFRWQMRLQGKDLDVMTMPDKLPHGMQAKVAKSIGMERLFPKGSRYASNPGHQLKLVVEHVRGSRFGEQRVRGEKRGEERGLRMPGIANVLHVDRIDVAEMKGQLVGDYYKPATVQPISHRQMQIASCGGDALTQARQLRSLMSCEQHPLFNFFGEKSVVDMAREAAAAPGCIGYCRTVQCALGVDYELRVRSPVEVLLHQIYRCARYFGLLRVESEAASDGLRRIAGLPSLHGSSLASYPGG
eukprot:COSAG01_NODE_5389_length_4291_cov_3.813931_1_plen_553_part_10